MRNLALVMLLFCCCYVNAVEKLQTVNLVLLPRAILKKPWQLIALEMNGQLSRVDQLKSVLKFSPPPGWVSEKESGQPTSLVVEGIMNIRFLATNFRATVAEGQHWFFYAENKAERKAFMMYQFASDRYVVVYVDGATNTGSTGIVVEQGYWERMSKEDPGLTYSMLTTGPMASFYEAYKAALE
jgi:hypothetical protein